MHVDSAMTPATINPLRPSAQCGIALIVGLVILAVLSLIGIAAFSITTQEERMAGNSRDRMRAFELAEAALRACETTVLTGGTAIFGASPGMYVGPATSSLPSITEGTSESWWQTPANVLQVTTGLGTDMAFPPSCVAEWITLHPNSGYTVSDPQNSTSAVNIAHITAHGYGLNRNTVVRLESYYSM
jgi:type IV pilus assembly protein PilX